MKKKTKVKENVQMEYLENHWVLKCLNYIKKTKKYYILLTRPGY